MKLLERLRNLKETLNTYRRVLIVSRKPTQRDFEEAAKICAIGMAILGAIGFIFYLISVLVGV